MTKCPDTFVIMAHYDTSSKEAAEAYRDMIAEPSTAVVQIVEYGPGHTPKPDPRYVVFDKRLAEWLLEALTRDEPCADIGTEIRTARAKLNISRAELAKRAGVSKTSLAHLEAGKDVRRSTVDAVTAALGLRA